MILNRIQCWQGSLISSGRGQVLLFQAMITEDVELSRAEGLGDAIVDGDCKVQWLANGSRYTSLVNREPNLKGQV